MLKAEEAKIADEITVLKAQLTEQLAKLAALKNADQVLTVAQAELAKAIDARTVAKATLDAEIDKLDQFLKNQRDAKAQYEAVKEACTQAQIVLSEKLSMMQAVNRLLSQIKLVRLWATLMATKLQVLSYSQSLIAELKSIDSCHKQAHKKAFWYC